MEEEIGEIEAVDIVLEYLFDHMGDFPEDTLLWRSVQYLWPEEYAEWHKWYSL